MEPHELINELVRRAGGSYRVAGEMGKRSFQGTLHKICSGFVKSPSRDSAERIAAFFHIPVEALYDAGTAERVHRQLIGGMRPPESAPVLTLTAREPAAAGPDMAWPFRTVTRSDIATLPPAGLETLEETMRLHITQIRRTLALPDARVANSH